MSAGMIEAGGCAPPVIATNAAASEAGEVPFPPEPYLTPAIKAFNATRREMTEFYRSHAPEGRRAAIEAHAISAAINAAFASHTSSGGDVTCDWDYDSDSFAWDAACGEKWSFVDGGPEENNVRFCHGCGNPVKLTAKHAAEG